MLIPNIDRLLEADEKNVRVTRQFFFDFSNDLPETLNTAAGIYQACTRAFTQGLDKHFQPLASCIIKIIGVSTLDELKAKLRGPIPLGQEESYRRCETTLNQFYSRQNRAVLLARIGVLYSLAVAEFLRMRITTPLACVRLQCESLALMKLMRDDPAIAREWQEIITEGQGLAFYRKYQKRVKSTLGAYDLSFAYDRASSVALHSRFDGIAFSLRVSSRIEGSQMIQRIDSLAQDFDPDNPYPFLLEVLHTLRGQEKIFEKLSDGASEIGDPLLLETRIPRSRLAVGNLFEQFKKQHPDLLERYRRSAERRGVIYSPPKM